MNRTFIPLTKEDMLANAKHCACLYRNNTDGMDPKLDIKVIDCFPDEGLTVVEYTIPSEFKNTNGLAHGGGICWIADSVMSLGCAASGDGGPNPTVDITVNFLKPCRIGDVLTCKTYTSQIGRYLVRAVLKIYVGSELRAEAMANYVRQTPPKP